MTTLAAHDQENVVRNLQTGPSGKPVLGGVKGLGAKTPGHKAPKTPFKVPLNDENAFTKAGKSVLKTNGKGGENVFLTDKKGGKMDENAFVTPAAQRIRAPLGMKTTNAKAHAFQTPAPLSSAKTQKLSPRMRRPKVKIHQPEPSSDSEDDVPEIEYMPPKELPLLDDMDDYLPRDWKVPVFDAKDTYSLLREDQYNPIEEDGRTKKQREFEEELEQAKKKRDEEFENIFEQQMAKDEAEMRRYMGIDSPQKKKDTKPAAAPGKPIAHKRSATVSTLKAKSAVSALCSAAPQQPSYAAPTVAAKSRLPTGLISRKNPVTKPLTNSTASRTTAAAAAAVSKSTIGYAQGRAVRTGAAVRKPLANVTKPAPFTVSRRSTSIAGAPHSRSASQPAATLRREALSRSSSTSTSGTLVPSSLDHPESLNVGEEEQDYRTAEDVAREMELLFLRSQEDDESDEEAWASGFGKLVEEPEEEEFQFTIPDGF